MNDTIAERIAVALEQIALELAADSVRVTPKLAANVTQDHAPFPPIGSRGSDPAWVCPVHGSSRIQPSGAVLGSSQMSAAGRPYSAFLTCTEYDCKEKAPRGPMPPRAIPSGQLP